MRAAEVFVAVVWAGFWLYWFVAAFSVKRSSRRIRWAHELGIRAAVVVLAVLLIRLGAFRDHCETAPGWQLALGLVLLVIGLAFAVWGRVHIGRNWGNPMSRKAQPELVTSGPYSLARHPIYSGILLAGVGTAVALRWTWLFAVLLAAVYFIYSALVEERDLSEQFPDTYPAYKRSTKMLVPFVL